MLGVRADYEWYSLGSIGAAVVVFVTVSKYTQPREAKQRMVTDFFARLARPVEPPPQQVVSSPSPFGIVGIVTLGLGTTLAVIGLTNTWPNDMLPCVVLGCAFALLGAGLVIAARCPGHLPRRESGDSS